LQAPRSRGAGVPRPRTTLNSLRAGAEPGLTHNRASSSGPTHFNSHLQTGELGDQSRQATGSAEVERTDSPLIRTVNSDIPLFSLNSISLFPTIPSMPTTASSSGGQASQPVQPQANPVVLAHNRRMPQPGEKNAPEFDVDKPQELHRFFERMDDWYTIESIVVDAEKKRRLVRYTDVDTEQQWKAMPEFINGTYDEFKEAILASYPKAVDVNRGSVEALKKKVRNLGMIDVSEKDVLLSLVRIMTAEVAKLKKLNPPIHTNRELVEIFLKCLTKGFAAKVAQKLSIHRVSTALAPNANQQGLQQPRNTEDMFDISEVMEMAKLTAQEHANPFAKYLGVSMSDSGGGETIAKLEETVASLKDTIKLQQANYQMIDQKLGALVQASTRNQQSGNYGMRTGNFAQGNSMGTEFKCFYCAELGHRVSDCVHLLAHMNKGWIKRVFGQLKLPDGQNIPRDGAKPTREIIEELNKVVPGLIPTARIKESLYQGGIQTKIIDKDEEATNMLLALVQQIGIGGLKRALEKENFHLAKEEDQEGIPDQDFYGVQ
jgi:hypothetical protein